MSCGDAVAVLGGDEASVAVIAVAVVDVAGQGEREGVPVQVVGVGDDELAQRGEVTLDGVEIAGVRRRSDELDVVRVGERADRWCPVRLEVVLDPVDPPAGRVAGADLCHEREVVLAAAAWFEPDPETVGVDIVSAHHVADAVPAVIRRALALGTPGGCPADPGRRPSAVGLRLTGPIWSKAITT